MGGLVASGTAKGLEQGLDGAAELIGDPCAEASGVHQIHGFTTSRIVKDLADQLSVHPECDGFDLDRLGAGLADHVQIGFAGHAGREYPVIASEAPFPTKVLKLLNAGNVDVKEHENLPCTSPEAATKGKE